MKTVSLTPNDLILRYAALLHDVGKPYVKTKNQRGYSNYVDHELVGAELALKIGTYLHWPKERITKATEIILHHLEPDSPLHEADTGSQVG